MVGFATFDGLSQDAHERVRIIVALLDFFGAQYREHCEVDLTFNPFWNSRKALEETITIIVTQDLNPANSIYSNSFPRSLMKLWLVGLITS